MAGGKEITTKIKSVENTKKVTSALEMVSASKIRKSQDLMNATRPYARMMRRIIGHLGKANPEYRHPFTIEHGADVKKVGYIIVSTDRGLCGGLNTNLFKAVLADMGRWQEGEDLADGIEIEQYHQQAVEAERNAGAVLHTRLERRQQMLIDFEFGQPSFATGEIVLLETRPLLGGVGQLGESVGEFDAIVEQLEALGDAGIGGTDPGQRGL